MKLATDTEDGAAIPEYVFNEQPEEVSIGRSKPEVEEYHDA